MKKKYLILLISLVIYSCGEKVKVEDLQKFVATEVYPEDTFLDTVKNKKAIVFVAHDDDDGVMAGTIAKLTSNGWTIKQICLQQHIGVDKTKHPATVICEGSELILEDGIFRIGMDTMKHSADPMSYDEIDKQFYTEKVHSAILAKINEFSPSVIFTLDDVKGGYGHPEHVFISRIVKNIFDQKVTSVEKIYQVVYTDHMEKEIMDVWLGNKMKEWGYPNINNIANRIYNVDGMPEPSVQVNISSMAEKKMNYLLAYDEDVRKNYRKFIPYYEEFDAEIYFKNTFNKEYFRVISH